MSRRSDISPVSQAIRDQAVEWHVRLSSDAAEEADWLAFEAWLDADSAHGAAYDQVEALWSDLDAAAPAAEVVRLKPRPRSRAAMWAWPLAIAASLAIAVGVGINLGRFGGPQPVTYETAKGASREVILADGTHVRLNSGSRISVVLGRHERRVEMADAEAEAAFDVAHDPGRPFIIDAGDRRIRVVGTEFDVLRHAGRVSVSVRRGVVEVRDAMAQAGAPPIARLVRGQKLEHREGAAGDRIAAVDPDKAFAWTQGRLVYENARLADVAADLNRYVTTPIVVSPEARDLRLTAVINLDAEDAMVRRLAGFLPVSVVRDGGVFRISLRSTRP